LTFCNDPYADPVCISDVKPAPVDDCSGTDLDCDGIPNNPWTGAARDPNPCAAVTIPGKTADCSFTVCSCGIENFTFTPFKACLPDPSSPNVLSLQCDAAHSYCRPGTRGDGVNCGQKLVNGQSCLPCAANSGPTHSGPTCDWKNPAVQCPPNTFCSDLGSQPPCGIASSGDCVLDSQWCSLHLPIGHKDDILCYVPWNVSKCPVDANWCSR
jgi:hypothetical protein